MGWKGCSSNLSFRYVVVANPWWSVHSNRDRFRQVFHVKGSGSLYFLPPLSLSFFLFSIIIVLSGSSKLSFNSPKNFHPTLEKSHFNEGEVSIDGLNFRERIFDIIRTNEKYIRANRKKMYIRSFNCGL